MLQAPFEINIALIGHVKAGKTTVLNAPLAIRMVKFFRVRQGGSSQSGWAVISDTPHRTAPDTMKELVADNANLRESNKIEEKYFAIELERELCQMRPDTQLVVVDVPRINEAGSSSKYWGYVAAKWNTFDCVVVVMDGKNGVNTEEQMSLLEFV